jgi:inner membrane protein
MDPVSQGVIGATFSQSFFQRKKLFPVAIAGAISGMVADLDISVRSSIDPLLFLEFHRQFTHSLIFIPIGALISSLFLFYFLRSYLSWKETYTACLLGYSTHALLDACTAYGTQLFWPFSSERIAWNNISIIDPLFTLPLIGFFIFACIKQSRFSTFLGISWAVLYMSIGMIQKHRAFNLGQEIALSRDHSAKFLTVKPSFGNLLLWKAIYEFDGFYYIDAVRLSLNSQFCPGEKIEKLNLKKHIKGLKKNSQQAIDIERFRKFSAGYLSYKPDQKLVIDTRYSFLPNKISPIWGIVINPQKKTKDHVVWWKNESPTRKQISEFLGLLYGDNCQDL